MSHKKINYLTQSKQQLYQINYDLLSLICRWVSVITIFYLFITAPIRSCDLTLCSIKTDICHQLIYYLSQKAFVLTTARQVWLFSHEPQKFVFLLSPSFLFIIYHTCHWKPNWNEDFSTLHISSYRKTTVDSFFIGYVFVIVVSIFHFLLE